jgi:type-F conjugative transfer system pilin assembly protein TrbC
MLRFIVLLLLIGSVGANENNLTDLEITKQVQSFANDINQHSVPNHFLKEQSMQSTDPKLMIFISTSMSYKSIQQWAKQAELFGAELIIRGFINNSFKETIMLAQELFNKDKIGGFVIDPFKFQQYSIDVVPTVVLDGDMGIDYVRGDIGLIEALKKL